MLDRSWSSLLYGTYIFEKQVGMGFGKQCGISEFSYEFECVTAMHCFLVIYSKGFNYIFVSMVAKRVIWSGCVCVCGMCLNKNSDIFVYGHKICVFIFMMLLMEYLM